MSESLRNSEQKLLLVRLDAVLEFAQMAEQVQREGKVSEWEQQRAVAELKFEEILSDWESLPVNARPKKSGEQSNGA